jgi:hypothetical protein
LIYSTPPKTRNLGSVFHQNLIFLSILFSFLQEMHHFIQFFLSFRMNYFSCRLDHRKHMKKHCKVKGCFFKKHFFFELLGFTNPILQWADKSIDFWVLAQKNIKKKPKQTNKPPKKKKKIMKQIRMKKKCMYGKCLHQ